MRRVRNPGTGRRLDLTLVVGSGQGWLAGLVGFLSLPSHRRVTLRCLPCPILSCHSQGSVNVVLLGGDYKNKSSQVIGSADLGRGAIVTLADTWV